MAEDHETADAGAQGAAADLDGADDLLLAELRSLYEVRDPVPPGLAERTKIAMTVQALHAEVAELVGPSLVAVRVEGGPSDDEDAAAAVTFSGVTASLMVAEVDASAPRLALDGWVTPAGATVEVHQGGDVRQVVADATGRFVVEDLLRGVLWFVVWPAGPQGGVRPLVTPSIEL